MANKKEIAAIKAAINEHGFVAQESPYQLASVLGTVPGKLVSESLTGKPFRFGNMVRLDLGGEQVDVPAHRNRVFEDNFDGEEVMVGIFVAERDFTTTSGTVIPKGKKAVKAYVEECLA